MTENFANLKGIKICYKTLGKGDPVLLVHGFGDRKEHWRAQIGDLSKHFNVIIFDNRGAGKSDRPDGYYTMEMFADDIAGLMDWLKIKKTNIIGHSLGGMIVQNFALKYPNRINKIVLINTSPGITPPRVDPSQGIDMYKKKQITMMQEIKNDPINVFLDHAKTGYSREFWKQMKNDPKKKFHGIWSVEDLIEEKLVNGPSEKDIICQSEALKSHNTYDRLNEIKNEVLILCADKDKTLPQLMSEKIHELLPNSKLIVIENAAHQSVLEYPNIINQHIIEFLKF
jgi:proline-specific peptidase